MTKGEAISRYPTLPRRQRNKNIGTPTLSGVRQDRFDHQVEFIGAVNLTRSPYA